MSVEHRNTLSKTERLNRKRIIETLFAGGARTFSVFPLRIVYIPLDSWASPATILISVSKKRFKRAVKRNRVKRQIREAYRKNKHDLFCMLEEKELKLAIAFIYLNDKLAPSVEMEQCMKLLLTRLIKKTS
ncbi:Ribonuclease P protein component [termite gut metagenome]|uniref:Ribonuclease P protein component n=1 Tax=termite gut metagenome TaxID=433724 RepID=A0A5J4PYL1_9ZZZZ